MLENLNEESRIRFIEHMAMAGKVRAGSGPAQELLANAERSGQQEFEPIGMIIRRMIDKSRKAAKEGQKTGQGEEVI